MKILIKDDVKRLLYDSIKKAGDKEIKGACFARYINDEYFEIEDIYISEIKGTKFFSNLIINNKYKKFVNSYFKKHNFDFTKHNYIGDWHSHPSFSCEPSSYDIKEACDEFIKSNANFLIQIILKIKDDRLFGNCFLYNSLVTAEKCELIIV